MNQSPGLAREEGHNMVVRDDANKRQVDGSSGAGDGKRYRGAAVSAVPNRKDVPLFHLARLAEDV
jgi:hypothetical protein